MGLVSKYLTMGLHVPALVSVFCFVVFAPQLSSPAATRERQGGRMEKVPLTIAMPGHLFQERSELLAEASENQQVFAKPTGEAILPIRRSRNGRRFRQRKNRFTRKQGFSQNETGRQSEAGNDSSLGNNENTLGNLRRSITNLKRNIGKGIYSQENLRESDNVQPEEEENMIHHTKTMVREEPPSLYQTVSYFDDSQDVNKEKLFYQDDIDDYENDIPDKNPKFNSWREYSDKSAWFVKKSLEKISKGKKTRHHELEEEDEKLETEASDT